MNIIRRFVERISRNKVIFRRIFVCRKEVPIFVSPGAQLKYWKIGKGVFDQDLINIAERYIKKQSNVWDIGANVGVFTFSASSIVTDGQILSIEADLGLSEC